VGGTAAVVSAGDLIQKAREKASHVLEASVGDIEYGDGMLTVVGTDRRVSLFDLAKGEKDARLTVDSQGDVDGPTWPNGTHICEVEIDPETGVTRVVRYTTVDDVGIAINPMLVTVRSMEVWRRASDKRCMKAWSTTSPGSCSPQAIRIIASHARATCRTTLM
jgi:carbon-monoxide dehydrogenase large subunit